MDPVQQVVQNHGDLIFDFCESTLRSPANAQIIFRNTLKKQPLNILALKTKELGRLK